MCSLERKSVQLIVHRLWTIGTSCCVQDSGRWCNKQHCTTRAYHWTSFCKFVSCYLFSFQLLSVSLLYLQSPRRRMRVRQQIHVAEDLKLKLNKKGLLCGIFCKLLVSCTCECKTSASFIDCFANKKYFCDVPSNADLSIACAAEQLFV